MSTPQTPGHRALVRTIIASQFAPTFMFSGVAVALPSLGHELGAGAGSLGLIETLFLASQVAFMLPAGRLSDAGDKRSLYQLGLLMFGVTSLLIALSSSVPLITALRFLQGGCSALCSATAPAILAELVPPEQRGRMFGRSIAAVYAGLMLGPACAGLLVDHAGGWRTVFIVTGAILLAVALITRRLMPSGWKPLAADTVHLPSAALMICTALALSLGSAGLHGGTGGPLLALGAVLLIGFVWLQRRLAKPLLDVRALVANRVLITSLSIQILLYMHAIATVFLLNLYMQVALGYPADRAGQIGTIGTLLMVAVAPLAGILCDRFPKRIVATLGAACIVVAGVLATRLDAQSSMWAVLAMLALQGVGFGFFSTPNITIIMGSVPPTRTGLASALTAMARSTGMVSGMLVTAVLISLQMGNAAIAENPLRFIDTMALVFTILTVVSVAALPLGLVARAPRGKA